MPTNILMPALSPTMEKGNLAKWLKKEGDTIKSGDIIAEIETDKATMEVEAVDEGVLAKITVPDGTTDVPVNQVIGVIAAEGEDVKAAAAGVGGGAAPERGQSEAPKGAPVPSTGEGQPAYARVDQAPKAAAEPSTAAQPSAAGNPNGSASPAGGEGGRVFASPLARRIAKDGGIDLAALAGSGPHGRVVLADVEAAKTGGGAKSAPTAAVQAGDATPAAAPAPKAAASAPAGMSGEAVTKMYEKGSYEEISLDGMRKTVAKRLTESKQTVPHFYLSLDVELDALMTLREQVNSGAPKDKEGKPAFKLSVNDFVIKALALALQRVPDANAVWAEDRILKFTHSDVGVAVAIEGGLFTPVIRKAESKTLSAISNEMKDLAGRARKRRLKPEEYTGGSTAVSNLGMFGIKTFQAVINPPHASILAVGAGEKRVVVKGDAPTVVQAMTVTLSVDHRAVDGALGAELLGAFKALIETPMTMLV